MFNKEQGISLIITFFIMTIILAMVLVISTILYDQIKVIKNMGDSVVAFYAADSGIEKVLYYDRKVIPSGAVRGFCAMLSYPENPDGECPIDDPVSAVNCICISPNCPPVPLDAEHEGCDIDKCNNCEISFNTDFPESSGYGYIVDAKVYPENGDITLNIGSAGLYKNVNRKVELDLSGSGEVEDIITITADVTPKSTEYGTEINISAYVVARYGAIIVQARIKETPEGTDVVNSPVPLDITSGDFYNATYEGMWSGPVGSYYVYIEVRDTEGNVVIENIWP